MAQDFKPIEIIVIDDGSTDETALIASQFEPWVTLLQGEGKGAGPARNLGIMAAKGEYIAFLDADDFWLPQKLSQQVELLKNGSLCATYSDYVLGPKRKPIGSSVKTKNDLEAMAYVKNGKGVPAVLSSWVLSKQDIISVGLFDENFRFAQDYDLLLRLIAHGLVINIVRVPLVLYLLHSNSSSAVSHKAQTMTAEYLRARHLNGETLGFDAWLESAKSKMGLRRRAKAGYLFRQAIVQKPNPWGFIRKCGYAISSLILDPVRFLHKLKSQSNFGDPKK